MSDDWQAGDLALCVSTKHRLGFTERLRVGAIYTVDEVGRFLPKHGERGLGLVESKPRLARHGWPETLFRKIHPHTPDEQDRETIRLLNLVEAEPVS